MLEFISHLKNRYQAIQSDLIEKNSQYQASLSQLCLIEAFLLKETLYQQAAYPLQIAVMGPTQSGKSSLVNVIANQILAGVSPLAGFTVHTQGFALNVATDSQYFITDFFTDLTAVAQYDLNHQQYGCYSLNYATTEHLPPCIIWDTPDFDSIEAQHYQQGVLKTVALADVLILVVSKEKYADQSVWELLILLAPLNQPIIVVLNKLLLASHTLIIDSFKQRWQASRTDAVPFIYPIMFTDKLAYQADLNAELKRVMHKVKHKSNAKFAKQFIEQHWDDWVLPLKIEQAAQAQWSVWVDEALEEAILLYQRDYLEHPQHYDTFQNALAKLLTLLEIPLLAKAVMHSRQVLAWPLRKLFKSKKQPLDNGIITQETAILEQIAQHMLLQLGDKVLDNIDKSQGYSQWWKAINRQLRQDKDLILQQFTYQTQRYHIDFKATIEATAQGLYQQLAEKPALLNGLRAMRVTTDAALLGLAVQAGGLGLHDLLIAPAMLSVTAYLAESAIGSYLQRSEAALKQQQLKTVETQLFQGIMQQALINLPTKIPSTPYFNISAQQLADAEAQLKVKPHGLRIF